MLMLCKILKSSTFVISLKSKLLNPPNEKIEKDLVTTVVLGYYDRNLKKVFKDLPFTPFTVSLKVNF